MADEESPVRRQTRLERYKEDLEDTDNQLRDWMQGAGGYGLGVLALIIAAFLLVSLITSLI